jgi:hypothetical protein
MSSKLEVAVPILNGRVASRSSQHAPAWSAATMAKTDNRRARFWVTAATVSTSSQNAWPIEN